MNELDIYRFAHTESPLTRRKKRVLRSITGLAKHHNVTQAWSYGGRLYGIDPINTNLAYDAPIWRFGIHYSSLLVQPSSKKQCRTGGQSYFL